MKVATLVTSCTALVAAIAALVVCTTLLMDVMQLNAVFQHLATAPAQSSPGVLTP